MSKPLSTKAQLVIEIEGTTITLNSDEARKLFNELKKFLGEDKNVVKQFIQTHAQALPYRPDRSWEWDRKIIGWEAPSPLHPSVVVCDATDSYDRLRNSALQARLENY